MVETIKVDTTVDRIKSKSKEDRAFALKLNNHFCPMTFLSQGKPDYPLLGQMFYPVELKKSTLKQDKNNRPVT